VKKETVITLRIEWDDKDGYFPPEKWAWEEILDETPATMLRVIPDSDDAGEALSALFKALDKADENGLVCANADDRSALFSARAMAEATCVRVGLLDDIATKVSKVRAHSARVVE
jgi:hypothetical protein